MQKDRKPSAEPPSRAKRSFPPPGRDRIVALGAGPAPREPNQATRRMRFGRRWAKISRSANTAVSPMAEGEKVSEPLPVKRPEDRRLPSPGPERIVRLGAGVDRA